MPGLPGNTNGLPSGVADSLGLGLDTEADDEKKKKLLQQQRERMGLSGVSVYGAAAASIFGAGNG